MERPRTPLPRIPLLASLAFAALALVLLALVTGAARPAPVSGAWVEEYDYAGTVAPGEPVDHLLVLESPATFRGDGVRFEPGKAVLLFRPSRSPDGQDFRVQLLDEHGMVRFDQVLEPALTMTRPHSVPTVSVGSGAYTLRVSAPADAPAAYALEVRTTLPFTASTGGLLLQPLALTLSAAAAGALALAPWGVALVRERARREAAAAEGEGRGEVQGP